MTSQLGKQTIAIHIFPISQEVQTIKIIKFGRLVEYDIKNNFLEKSYTKCSGEAIPDPFLKNQN